MKLIKPKVDIPPKDPFANDMFQRKSFAEGITNLITDVDHPMTLAIDAAWGEGKTTFAEMWGQRLKNEGIPVVYFDAFKKDSSSDAFMALAAEFIKLAKDKTSEERSLVEKLTKSTLGVAKAALPLAAKSAIKLASAGLIDGDKTTDEIIKEFTGISSQIVEERLNEHLKDDEIREEFRTALADLVEAYNETDGEGNAEKSIKPLVIIIDELDRCRPPFALSILEAIKHYFDVSNIVFVFMLNGKQLENSIIQEYGADEKSARIYLEKFFTLKMRLPFIVDHHDEQADKIEYVADVLRKLGFFDLHISEPEVVSFLMRFAIRKQISLRTIERICTDVYLVYKFMTTSPSNAGPAIAMLSAMRVMAPELYENARIKQLTYLQAIEFFGYEITPEKKNAFSEAEYRDLELIRFCLDTEFQESNELSNYMKNLIRDYGMENRLGSIPFLCRNYVDVFT